MILDLVIHDIDFMRWVIGEVSSVYAIRKQDEGLDYALITLRFQSGALANLEGFWGYPGPFTTSVEIIGDKGIIRSGDQPTTTTRLIKAEDLRSDTVVPVPAGGKLHDPYYREIRHFIDCIRYDTPPMVTEYDAYRSLEVALAAEKSVDIGEPVYIDNSKGRTIPGGRATGESNEIRCH